ncbi:ABC transporter permease [Allorhodopirellula heiligendammensis]|nr:ABC transporter permease [Allorhodopirellula heiligendammensis]
MNELTLPSRLNAAWMLARREWTRFFRQRNRVTAAVLQPLLFWLLFGTGLSGSFASAGGENFLQFFLPGTVALIVLFTAIFATISVIEDRREGFMQSVLVSPVGRFPVLIGKVLGGGAIAWVQALLFLTLVYIVSGVTHSSSLPTVTASLPLVMLLLAIIAIAMCALGMIVAWPMESTQGFHAIMMLGLMPMWLLAGTFFPIPAWSVHGPTGEAGWGGWALAGIMQANPLSYAMLELRRLINPTLDLSNAGFAPSSLTCWTVTLVATAITVAIAWMLMRGSRRADTMV